MSAILKNNGFETSAFLLDGNKNIVSEIHDYRPDIVAATIMTPSHIKMFEILRELKKRFDKPVIVGGAHTTFYPDAVDWKVVDAICIGDGEYAMLDYAKAVRDAQQVTGIQNLWVKQDDRIVRNSLRPIVPLADLPFPDFSLYYDKYPQLRSDGLKRFLVAKGCPFNCSFCFNMLLKEMYAQKGEYVRFKHPEQIIKEVEYVRDNYGLKWAQFECDTINLNRKWLKSFLDLYTAKIRIPFLCNIRIDLMDDELAQDMKKAGCDRVDFGLEHGNEKLRREILNRNMNNEQILAGAKALRTNKLRFHTTNIIGLCGETIENALETVDLNRRIGVEHASFSVLQLFPNTMIYKYARQNGYLSRDYTPLEVTYCMSTVSDLLAKNKSDRSNFVRRQSILEQNNIDQLVNLSFFAGLLVKCKLLTPVIMRLIQGRPNRIYLFANLLPTWIISLKYENRLSEKMKIIRSMTRVLFFQPGFSEKKAAGKR